MYKSRVETYKHIRLVQKWLNEVIEELLKRQLNHDNSKLEPPEVEIFDEYTPKLAGLTYGTEEYKKMLQELKPALDHHYRMNRHHPEHFNRGIEEMSLIDLLEMLCDWMAATQRHKDGNIDDSIEINQKRFRYSDELKKILHNTVAYIRLIASGGR